MHLLATTSGVIDGAAEAIDLKQSPGVLIVLTAADSEIANLSRAFDNVGGASLRLANIMALQHPLSVDLYIEKTCNAAKLIVLRLLGGAGYWSYGLEAISVYARANDIAFVVLPGDSQPDADLTSHSTISVIDCERLRQYLVPGGQPNAEKFLQYCEHLINGTAKPDAAEPLAAAGLYKQSSGQNDAALLFYRSVLEGGQSEPIDALLNALEKRGIGCSAIYVTSLKDASSIKFIADYLATKQPQVILNATSFAASSGGTGDPLAVYDCPVLQVVLATMSEESWSDSSAGLGMKDLAMNVVMPELDGRIHSRAISFKSDSHYHEPTESRIVTYKSIQNRVDFVADLAANWVSLRVSPAPLRRIAIILANYPDKDGRIANGVGYDTPASTIAIFEALTMQGYGLVETPTSGNALIARLTARRNNQLPSNKAVLDLKQYHTYFNQLPETIRTQMTERWGAPDTDPFVRGGTFHFAIELYGNVAVGIQPARGYGIDPKATYHDAALVPPHGYLAYYFWLQFEFGAHALVHNGKHGNLEWLPGKANGLSENCFPEIVHGPLPQLYPFIVNDPGEGTQAKRRTSAVIIDHLTPPLTRAETYGPLKDLEALVDEYYLASGLDQRRVKALKQNILDLTRSEKLDLDAGFTGDDDGDLTKLDAYLCDLKEAQIRDGLHILGTSPTGQQETDLLVALTRVPRGLGEGKDQSLIRALAHDFGFGEFDPLSCKMAESWQGPRPSELLKLLSTPWRSNGDAVERLELFAAFLIASSRRRPGSSFEPPQLAPGFRRDDSTSKTVLAEIENTIRPALSTCGPNEISNLLAGLNGRRVAPGPSGAPTRGRLDILPTGRNFYSLDNRTVPTPTAWNLGRKSAELLLIRHFQDQGQYPQSIGLSAWGTANMRTGGDDIAQALALIGAKPIWEPSSWRVTGFEILPIAALGRPRVDVTLRISGFFRDAFPAQIELLDRAMRAAGALDEDAADNPIAARMKAEAAALVASGIASDIASNMAGHRIFGSKPGAYGAGLQALIDEKIWDEKSDLAAAYVTWGAYAYGASTSGVYDKTLFKTRLVNIEAVVHNQDNREHDLLDSDDYYQFEGGMTVAVETVSGKKPVVYHNDHSRPERPVIRTLEEEIGRVMRSRVVNPKWIVGVKRHGYKGAFEIAATIDYMFAFAATTGAVKTHHFDLAFDAFLADDDTRKFIAENNPAALREIAARLEEAIARGLWIPRLNSAYDRLKELQQ
jgi:cobaltochelatase CobN